MPTTRRTLLCAAATFVACGASLSACTSTGAPPDEPPPPHDRPSDDIADSAERWLGSDAPVRALGEIVDAASQEFVNALSRNPRVKASEFQIVMLVDEFSDLSGADNEGLEQALKSAHRTLARNEVMRENFVFLASAEDNYSAVIGETSGDGWDAADPFGNRPSTAPARYHPDYVYALSGEMAVLRAFESGRLKLILRMEVVHPRTRQLVESYEFDRMYERGPNDRWSAVE